MTAMDIETWCNESGKSHSITQTLVVPSLIQVGDGIASSYNPKPEIFVKKANISSESYLPELIRPDLLKIVLSPGLKGDVRATAGQWTWHSVVCLVWGKKNLVLRQTSSLSLSSPGVYLFWWLAIDWWCRGLFMGMSFTVVIK